MVNRGHPSSTVINRRQSWSMVLNHDQSWPTLVNHRQPWSTVRKGRPVSAQPAFKLGQSWSASCAQGSQGRNSDPAQDPRDSAPDLGNPNILWRLPGNPKTLIQKVAPGTGAKWERRCLVVVNRGQPWPTVVKRGQPWSTVVKRGQLWSTMVTRG